jgi:hypothetical protein
VNPAAVLLMFRGLRSTFWSGQRAAHVVAISEGREVGLEGISIF